MKTLILVSLGIVCLNAFAQDVKISQTEPTNVIIWQCHGLTYSKDKEADKANCLKEGIRSLNAFGCRFKEDTSITTDTVDNLCKRLQNDGPANGTFLLNQCRVTSTNCSRPIWNGTECIDGYNLKYFVIDDEKRTNVCTRKVGSSGQGSRESAK